ncbi:YraN family protein [Dorea sp. D27]|uniref:YraN family protein n=1 Tax=Dorea sp. D27 TaxID=658665 RepID=UPI0006738C61|nr:YraN family protein [Dorea sp. D27]KMZ55109.1 endonuclease [Dorea sp. D27]
MAYNKRAEGSRYEQMAGTYLEECGYEIIRYNYRCRIGEIDIIARDKDALVFCEVKYRRNTSKGHPAEAVDARKQRVLAKCAMCYITVNGLSGMSCRFDVIAILGGEISHIKNAFEC